MLKTKLLIKMVEGCEHRPHVVRVGDVCFDACSQAEYLLEPGSRVKVPLGFCCELEEGFEMEIRPRSGLSLAGIDGVLGTVDTNYRGEVAAILINNAKFPYIVHAGDRVCQCAVREVPRVVMEEVAELSGSERGGAGFGSSGGYHIGGFHG